MQETGMKPSTAYVDLGYRGVDADKPGIDIKPDRPRNLICATRPLREISARERRCLLPQV